LIEHSAQPDAIHDTTMHGKAHDATRAVVHDDENPVGAQDGGFASKQIETPQTVLRVTEDGEPGRPSRVWSRLAPNGKNAPHHILGDGNREGQGDLLSNPWTPASRVPPFHVDNCGDDFLGGSLWAPASSAAWRRRGADISAVSALDGVLTALRV
jgi:hypothetical protein